MLRQLCITALHSCLKYPRFIYSLWRGVATERFVLTLSAARNIGNNIVQLPTFTGVSRYHLKLNQFDNGRFESIQA